MNPQIELEGRPPLTDAEIEELDRLLASVPEDYDPLDVGMLDGFLAGVLLNPRAIAEAEWLPRVFDAQGQAGAAPSDPARALDLIRRREREIAAAIAARDAFEPVIFPLADDETDEPLTGADGIAALEPWAVGFMNALETFPGVLEHADPALWRPLAGVLRHLPAEDQEGELAELKAAIEHEAPLADLDEALEHLIVAVLEVADVTRPRRPLVRETPKVGRNDPCPCGSGKKYKACHGAT
jgi:uncharacterized protein